MKHILKDNDLIFEAYTKSKPTTKYSILAQAFDPNTGAPLAAARAEVVDISTNQLFKGCKSILDVHEAYESFWNKLSSHHTELVFVQKITPIK